MGFDETVVDGAERARAKQTPAEMIYETLADLERQHRELFGDTAGAADAGPTESED